MSERARCGSVRRTVIARGPPSGTIRGSRTSMRASSTADAVAADAQTSSGGSFSRLLMDAC